jgi:hypothetical protein
MTPPQSEETERPPVSLNGAEWGKSKAKHLMAQDMLDGLVPTGERIRDIKKLFDELYAHQPEFADFPFDKIRYTSRISRLQTVVGRVTWASAYDEKLLAEAREVYPPQTHGPTGTILWEGSEADTWLKIDMAASKHLLMKPKDLRETRPCYKLFTVRRFSKRIDQLKTAAKPYGVNPMQAAAKRAKKQLTKVKNRPEISRYGTQEQYRNTP